MCNFGSSLFLDNRTNLFMNNARLSSGPQCAETVNILDIDIYQCIF